jgi:hypothetical protein
MKLFFVIFVELSVSNSVLLAAETGGGYGWIIYLVGLVVIVMAILSFLGLH